MLSSRNIFNAVAGRYSNVPARTDRHNPPGLFWNAGIPVPF